MLFANGKFLCKDSAPGYLPEGWEKMKNDTARKAPLTIISEHDDLHLTAKERRLILNFRATKVSAKEMLLDLSDQYKRTLPAEPVKLRLLGSGK
jgi:hypothetical protein